MSVELSELTTIRAPVTEAEVEAARVLFLQHFARVGIDPTFGGIEEELAGLPGLHAPPHGALLVAVVRDGGVLGAGAMRPLPGPGDCNLTALVVAEAARGHGLGRRLAQALLAAARAAGHRRMHLDTADEDPAAMALWDEAGFLPAPAYFPNPRPGARHMALDLTQGA